MAEIDRVPKCLLEYYCDLKDLLKEKKHKEARRYLHNLPKGIYDMIIEKSGKSKVFNNIISQIEDSICRNDHNDIFKVNSRNSDNNFIC